MRPVFGLALLLVFGSLCHGQRVRPVSLKVRSCAVADSLLGPMHGGGSVWATFRPGADSGEVYTAGTELMVRSVNFSAMLHLTDRNPAPYPAPVLHFVVHEQPLA